LIDIQYGKKWKKNSINRRFLIILLIINKFMLISLPEINVLKINILITFNQNRCKIILFFGRKNGFVEKFGNFWKEKSL